MRLFFVSAILATIFVFLLKYGIIIVLAALLFRVLYVLWTGKPWNEKKASKCRDVVVWTAEK